MTTKYVPESHTEASDFITPRSQVAHKLMTSARRLFTINGYTATTVTEITKDAGTSVGTLYYHYGGKAEVINALYEDYSQQHFLRVRRAIRLVKHAGVSDRRNLFLVGTRTYLSAARAHRDMSRALGEGDAPGGFASVSKEYSQRWERHNSRLLQINTETAGGSAVIDAIMGAIRSWSRALADIDDDDTANEYIDRIIDILARMIQSDE